MRPSLWSACAAALLLCFLATPAVALQGWEAGGDVGLLLRQQPGGNRSVLPALSLRGSILLHERASVGVTVAAAHASGGGAVAAASTLHNRLALRAEARLGVRRAVFVLGAGPAVATMYTRLADRGAVVQSVFVPRVGATAGVALDVPLRALRLRSGMDVVLAGDRADFLFSVGAGFSGRRP